MTVPAKIVKYLCGPAHFVRGSRFESKTTLTWRSGRRLFHDSFILAVSLNELYDVVVIVHIYRVVVSRATEITRLRCGRITKGYTKPTSNALVDPNSAYDSAIDIGFLNDAILHGASCLTD
jgi:hypothetical protein